MPMVAVMRQELIGGPYIEADETPVEVEIQEGRGRIIKPISGSTADQEGQWCSTFVWAADGRDHGSSWASSRSAADGRVCRVRANRRAEDGACGMLVACRRYFAEAEQLHSLQDAVATAIVARIDELFTIDAEAR